MQEYIQITTVTTVEPVVIMPFFTDETTQEEMEQKILRHENAKAHAWVVLRQQQDKIDLLECQIEKAKMMIERIKYRADRPSRWCAEAPTKVLGELDDAVEDLGDEDYDQ
jgi:hypothetical protein